MNIMIKINNICLLIFLLFDIKCVNMKFQQAELLKYGLQEMIHHDEILLNELLNTYNSDLKDWPYIGHPGYLSLQSLPQRHLYNSYAVFPGANSIRNHGILGVFPNKTPAYIPAPLPPKITKDNFTDELKDGGFYLKLSNAISLDRYLKDTREPVCRNAVYDLKTLDDVSIIITFYNEAFSTLMRTLHSVLNLTPPCLLREIILVDDHSMREDTPKEKISSYIRLLPKVKLIRHTERRGLVVARLTGIRAASAPVIVVLDSHIETTPNWLEAQLEIIKNDPNTLVFPQIPSINSFNMEPADDVGIGCHVSFYWSMREKSSPLIRPKSQNPLNSPALAGGLFAIRRDVFWNAGGFDEEFSMWGAENVELGFRSWLCGFSVKCAPCSSVYHIYRSKGTGYSLPYDLVLKNRLRTARVWLDDMYNVSYNYNYYKTLDLGPFDKMIELKRRLRCKPFRWFIKSLAPEYSDFADSNYMLIHSIRNVAQNEYCIGFYSKFLLKHPYGVIKCLNPDEKQGFFYSNVTKTLSSVYQETSCLDTDFLLNSCNEIRNMKREWIFHNRTIRSSNHLNECVGMTPENFSLHYAPCNSSDSTIYWDVIPSTKHSNYTPIDFSKRYKELSRALYSDS